MRLLFPPGVSQAHVDRLTIYADDEGGADVPPEFAPQLLQAGFTEPPQDEAAQEA